jgi:thioredoxin-like negative regulator of GroEL
MSKTHLVCPNCNATNLLPDERLQDEQMIAGRYGIRSIPTMVLFHKGEEIARQSGAMMAADIIRWVESQTS